MGYSPPESEQYWPFDMRHFMISISMRWVKYFSSLVMTKEVFYVQFWNVLHSAVLTMGIVCKQYNCRWNVLSTRGSINGIIRVSL